MYDRKVNGLVAENERLADQNSGLKFDLNAAKSALDKENGKGSAWWLPMFIGAAIVVVLRLLRVLLFGRAVGSQPEDRARIAELTKENEGLEGSNEFLRKQVMGLEIGSASHALQYVELVKLLEESAPVFDLTVTVPLDGVEYVFSHTGSDRKTDGKFVGFYACGIAGCREKKLRVSPDDTLEVVREKLAVHLAKHNTKKNLLEMPEAIAMA
jgi:hypothetical protein